MESLSLLSPDQLDALLLELQLEDIELFPPLSMPVQLKGPDDLVRPASPLPMLPSPLATEATALPVTEATEATALPVTEATEATALPEVGATEATALPVTEATEATALPVTEAAEATALPVTEAAEATALPATESLPVTEALPVTSTEKAPAQQAVANQSNCDDDGKIFCVKRIRAHFVYRRRAYFLVQWEGYASPASWTMQAPESFISRGVLEKYCEKHDIEESLWN